MTPFVPPPLEYLIWIVLLNLTLTGLHKFLGYVKDKTENKIDDRLFDFVGYLLKLLEWIMMNRRPPG